MLKKIIKIALIIISLTETQYSYTLTSPNCDFITDLVCDYTYNGTDGSDGSPQTFIAPFSGHYRIELWGAGSSYEATNDETIQLAGRGGYVSGTIYLTGNQQFSVLVGGRKTTDFGAITYNGGGEGSGDTNAEQYGSHHFVSSGGGATDLRLTHSSLASRIIIAGGGGGGGTNSKNHITYGGHGGDLIGGTSLSGRDPNIGSTTGGTQITGGTAFPVEDSYESYGQTNGTFGQGGAGSLYGNRYLGGGGGGGYWGGGGGGHIVYAGFTGGGGGSSYISGHPGAIAITSATDTTPRTDHQGNSCNPTDQGYDTTPDLHPECSHHYSGLIFTDTLMSAGNESMPDYNNCGATMIGNTGNGHARITYVGSSLGGFISMSLSTPQISISELSPITSEPITTSHTITVITSNPTGYTLKAMTESSQTALIRKDPTDPTKNTLLPMITQPTTTLPINTWGLSIDNGNTFQPIPPYTTDSGTTIKTTQSSCLCGDQTTVTYGARVDMSAIAGDYVGVVVYTVVAN
jgi:hypothetical protein